MRVRTTADLGTFIRERRVKLAMDQSNLAEKAEQVASGLWKWSMGTR